MYVMSQFDLQRIKRCMKRGAKRRHRYVLAETSYFATLRSYFYSYKGWIFLLLFSLRRALFAWPVTNMVSILINSFLQGLTWKTWYCHAKLTVKL